MSGVDRYTRNLMRIERQIGAETAQAFFDCSPGLRASPDDCSYSSTVAALKIAEDSLRDTPQPGFDGYSPALNQWLNERSQALLDAGLIAGPISKNTFRRNDWKP